MLDTIISYKNYAQRGVIGAKSMQTKSASKTKAMVKYPHIGVVDIAFFRRFFSDYDKQSMTTNACQKHKTTHLLLGFALAFRS